MFIYPELYNLCGFMAKEIPALTRAQMMEMDQRAVESGVPVRELMEHAGKRTAEVAAKLLHNKGRVLCCAGKGNNGGDALCAARHLKKRGFGIEVLHPFPESGFGGEAGRQLGALKGLGVKNTAYLGKRTFDFSGFGLVIDGLLGFSLEGNPRGKYAELIAEINAGGKKVLAVDLPSGLDADTGKVGNPCIRASATITFGLPKKGLMEKGAKEFAGKLYLGRIGMPPELYEGQGVKGSEIFGTEQVIEL